jgi:hypothetical protein
MDADTISSSDIEVPLWGRAREAHEGSGWTCVKWLLSEPVAPRPREGWLLSDVCSRPGFGVLLRRRGA